MHHEISRLTEKRTRPTASCHERITALLLSGSGPDMCYGRGTRLVLSGDFMKPEVLSRRVFLERGAGAAGAAWARVALPSLAAISQAAAAAKEDATPYTVLGADEAQEFAAIADRIIPTTDTPGATEAGVIYFMDQSFGTFNAPLLPMLRGGLKQLQSGISDGKRFSALSAGEQDALLEANEATPFFGLIRMITFAGFFGLSEYGGNKDGVGWKLLGMDPHAHAYVPPFGHYDAEYGKEATDDDV